MYYSHPRYKQLLVGYPNSPLLYPIEPIPIFIIISSYTYTSIVGFLYCKQ